MLRELLNQPKVVGVKQSRRAILEGRALRVLLACDADPAIIEPLARLCQEAAVPAQAMCNMAELGHAAGIQVGAAVVTVLRQ